MNAGMIFECKHGDFVPALVTDTLCYNVINVSFESKEWANPECDIVWINKKFIVYKKKLYKRINKIQFVRVRHSKNLHYKNIYSSYIKDKKEFKREIK